MFENLITQDVASLVPYPPGKPQEELERELGITGSIKLASNENPLGPSPKALQAAAAVLSNLHRYPDGRGYYLKDALAKRLGVEMDQIVLGNGSNEIIELSVRTFMRPGLEAVFSDPAFLMYSKVVQGGGGVIRQVPLKNFRHDLPGLAAKVTDKTRLVILDNPNNPTGSLLTPDELRSFRLDLPKSAVLLIDEAYVDFVREDGALVDPVQWINGDRPVVFLRTFSKAYGLAGLRIGFGLAHRELVGYMDRVRQPFNVGAVGQAAALAALNDEEFLKKTLDTTWNGLQWLADRLRSLGLKTYPTHTNFMMIELDKPASEVADQMLRQGVIIRSMASYGLDRCIRINAGTPEENQRFVKALEDVLERIG